MACGLQLGTQRSAEQFTLIPKSPRLAEADEDQQEGRTTERYQPAERSC
jgi:hypothetical protein